MNTCKCGAPAHLSYDECLPCLKERIRQDGFCAPALERFEVFGFVVDRTNFRQACIWARALESPTSKHGWSKGLQMFAESPAAQFLFMVAEDKHRVELAAPMIGLVANLKDLANDMKYWAPKCDGRPGSVFMLLVDEKTGARLNKILGTTPDRMLKIPATAGHEAIA
jgi:hypothetical protein